MQYLPPDLRTAIERMRLIGSDTQHFEVKSAGKAIPENLSETISAFANRDGGTIILGLDEKNHFAAVPDFNAAAVHDALLRLGDDFTPPCRLNIERFPFENNEIVVAVVEAAPLDQRPCYITKKGLRYGSFIRTGDGDKRLTDYEIERLREFHRQPSFDREPIDEASIDDLNASVLEAIVQRNREISPRIFGKMEPMDILTKLGAIAPDGKDGGRYVPTLAGLLSAGIYPQEFFPRLNITFTVYPGLTKAQTDGVRYLATESVNGSIPEMLVRSLELLKKHMSTGALIRGGLRHEITDYPIEACREAIINALQHRDYSPSGRGSQVQINMFADRLEILNPGGLYGAASSNSLPLGISATRNSRLSHLLEYTPYVNDGQEPGYVIENRGTGLQQIKLQLQESGMPEADLKDYVSAFQITFFKRRPAQDEREQKKLWANFDNALIAELEKTGSLSVAQIMERSGLSRNSVSTKLRKLKNSGVIETTEKANSPKQRYRLVNKEA